MTAKQKLDVIKHFIGIPAEVQFRRRTPVEVASDPIMIRGSFTGNSLGTGRDLQFEFICRKSKGVDEHLDLFLDEIEGINLLA